MHGRLGINSYETAGIQFADLTPADELSWMDGDMRGRGVQCGRVCLFTIRAAVWGFVHHWAAGCTSAFLGNLAVSAMCGATHLSRVRLRLCNCARETWRRQSFAAADDDCSGSSDGVEAVNLRVSRLLLLVKPLQLLLQSVGPVCHLVEIKKTSHLIHAGYNQESTSHLLNTFLFHVLREQTLLLWDLHSVVVMILIVSSVFRNAGISKHLKSEKVAKAN